ncbi:MAG TPA: hypothetical protein VF200_00990 [Woeseiaceae bacterium]
MGSAKIQGQLWGARARDWAGCVEQVSLPLFGAALDAARVTAGTRLLDAGCGAGLLAVLGSFRGAEVTAFDRAHRRPDGSVRYENVFLWVAGERP